MNAADSLKVVNSTRQGIKSLEIKSGELEAGSAEMAFLIPRNIFENHLGLFAKELGFFNRLITHVNEALTTQAEPVQLKQISSSLPTITVETCLAAMTAIGTAINMFLVAWKKVEEIREVREKIRKLGMHSKAAITEFTEEINTTVNEVVETSTLEIIGNSQVEPARKNELEGLIRKDFAKLFSQIERGLVVEIRVSPAPKTEDADKNLETLKGLSQSLQFPLMINDPVLLTSGDLLDDDDDAVMIRRDKKTTTSRQTSTKKKTTKTTEDQSEGQ